MHSKFCQITVFTVTYYLCLVNLILHMWIETSHIHTHTHTRLIDEIKAKSNTNIVAVVSQWQATQLDSLHKLHLAANW